MDIVQILNDFCIKGEFSSYEVVTAGNINTTYKVFTIDNGKTHQYLFQKINKNVFKSPELIMENITKVNDYIDNSSNVSDLVILHFIKSKNNLPYFIDEDGGFWRVCKFFDCDYYNSTDDLEIIEGAGIAFGEFQYLLRDYDASTLHITIPDFHNTEKRLLKFKNTVKYSTTDRIKECEEEIKYVLSNVELGSTLCKLLENNELPLRVTHNDTKCNNVIFKKGLKKALAVVDLDTIMPGLCGYDFGDGARSICSSTEEDEADVSKVYFDLNKFESFTKGYFKFLKNTITEKEKSTFALSVYVMTLELAVRFLQDYLDGDVYFKTTKEKHNLIRTRCQIALCKDIFNKLLVMNEIVKKYT